MLKHTSRQLRLMTAASLAGAVLNRMLSPEAATRRAAKKAAALSGLRTVTPRSIAGDPLDQGLKEDELFDAMWGRQYDAGIKPSAVYQEYRQLREHRPTD